MPSYVFLVSSVVLVLGLGWRLNNRSDATVKTMMITTIPMYKATRLRWDDSRVTIGVDVGVDVGTGVAIGVEVGFGVDFGVDVGAAVGAAVGVGVDVTGVETVTTAAVG